MKNPKVTYENGSTYIQMPGRYGDLIRVEGEATVWLHHPVEGDSGNELLLGDAHPGGTHTATAADYRAPKDAG